MNPHREAELNAIRTKLEALNDQLEILREQEENARLLLPKKSRERRRADDQCDCIDDAIDSVTDAIHALEELLEPEEV